MTSLLIIFHSQSGRNESLALHCYEKAKQQAQVSDKPVSVTLRRAFDCELDEFAAASFVLFITPENFAAIPGGMKDFFDRTFYPAERLGVQAKSYCCIIDCGNDGSQTALQIEKIMKGLHSTPAQPPLVLYGEPDEDSFGAVEELTEALVCAIEMGVY